MVPRTDVIWYFRARKPSSWDTAHHENVRWRAVSETHPVGDSSVEQQTGRSRIIVGQNSPS